MIIASQHMGDKEPEPTECFVGSRTFRDAGHVLAIVIGVAASHGNIGPCPVAASTRATNNDDVVSIAIDGTTSVNILHGQVRDGNSARWIALEVAALVILFDENTVSRMIISVIAIAKVKT